MFYKKHQAQLVPISNILQTVYTSKQFCTFCDWIFVFWAPNSIRLTCPSLLQTLAQTHFCSYNIEKALFLFIQLLFWADAIFKLNTKLIKASKLGIRINIDGFQISLSRQFHSQGLRRSMARLSAIFHLCRTLVSLTSDNFKKFTSLINLRWWHSNIDHIVRKWTLWLISYSPILHCVILFNIVV